MNVIITENYDEMSKKAAEIIIDIVKNNPNAILGLATGSSPIGTYKNMAKAYENGEVDVAGTGVAAFMNPTPLFPPLPTS